MAIKEDKLYRILRTILFLQECCVQATTANILIDAGEDVKDCMYLLERWDLACLHRDEWVISEHGDEFLRAAKEHPYYADDGAFADEVLSGMTVDGEPTSYSKPVLPSGSHPFVTDPDRLMVAIVGGKRMVEEAVDGIARRYSYDLGKISDLHDENRIAMCTECQCWGVFRIHNETGRLRSKCTICEGRYKERG